MDTSQKHDIAEKETVEAYVEYHPASKNVSPPPLSESPVKATTDERPKNARLRRTSKVCTSNVGLKRKRLQVMPATDLEGSAADDTIDYKVFENSQKIKRRRSSPLRTKTFDSKALFHPGIPLSFETLHYFLLLSSSTSFVNRDFAKRRR